jgi:prepilin-type N-terminal cleavage/methylation domain-containing protein
LLTTDTARTRQGFTMIELMVASAMMFVIVGYAMATFTIQHQTYVVVDQVSETQQNTRAIASLLERDARNAGYLVPSAGATCGIDNTGSPDVLFLSSSEAIRPPDELGASLASRELGSEVATITSGSPDTITVDNLVIDGQATYDTDADGTADSDYQIGGGVILVDVANPDLGVLCGTITGVSTSAPWIISANLTAASWTGTPSNPTDIRAIPAHVYQLTGSSPPALQRNGVLLAKDVEDMQIAWFLDADGDNEVEGTEYAGDAPTNTYDPQGQDGSELRELRINLVSRTRDNDPRNPTKAGRGQGTENRDTNVAGADGRRRRVHTATIRLRNLPAS